MNTLLLSLAFNLLFGYPDDGISFKAGYDTVKIIDSYLTGLASEKNFSGGFLIIKNGKKVLSKGYGWANKEMKIPFTTGTLASMGSITKAFTAAAIMKMTEQSIISPDDQLNKFFPEIPADKATITIHQLLTHSSGFHEFLKQDGGDYEKIGKDEFLKRAFSEPLAFSPGEKAVYTNVGMSILAIIAEQVSGLEYEQVLKTTLFDPLGIKNIGYHYPQSEYDTIATGYQNGIPWGTHQTHFEKAGGGPYWNLKGNGGLQASINDMFLWCNGITYNTILKQSTIEKMFTPHIPEEGTDGNFSFGYGCNISRSRRNTKLIGNGGSNGIYFAQFIRLPEEGVVFYMVTNESSMNSNMVLPNVTQLYFNGIIEQDATSQGKFKNQLSEKIYSILESSPSDDFENELNSQNVRIDDDMILLEVGQMFTLEKKYEKAIALYKFYTKSFPDIVVAWNDLGDIYRFSNNNDEAIKCYREALKIRPGNPRAQQNLDQLLKSK